MKTANSIGMAILASALCGCGEKAFDPGNPYVNEGFVDYSELTPRLREVKVASAPKKLAEIQPEEIVVAVNGYPLTRAEFDERLAVSAAFIAKQAEGNTHVAEKKLEEVRRQLIDQFVNARLLMDESRELKLLDPTNVCRQVRDFVMADAKAKRIETVKLIKSYPGDPKYMYYSIAERIWIEAVMAAKIPPVCTVDDVLMSNVVAGVAEKNRGVARRNKIRRDQLDEIRSRILAGKLSFADAAKKYSTDDKTGKWGTWAKGEMPDKELQAQIFIMKKGELTVLEETGCYHLARVTEVVPQVVDADGIVRKPEVRTCEHIVVPREGKFICPSGKGLYRDLAHQMQTQAIVNHLTALKTNGVTRIVYPYGSSLF